MEPKLKAKPDLKTADIDFDEAPFLFTLRVLFFR